jgi:hypothetical protein
LDQRHIKVYPFEPLEAGLPGARSLVVIERASTFDDNEQPTLAFYVTSHYPTPFCARRFGELARGHWGGRESRNHWVPDAQMREDKTRSKNYRLNCNLSALCSAWWRSQSRSTPQILLARTPRAMPA